MNKLKKFFPFYICRKNSGEKIWKFKNNSYIENDLSEIEYGCFYKSRIKPVYKGSSIELIDYTRKEYYKLLGKGWKKTNIFKSYF